MKSLRPYYASAHTSSCATNPLPTGEGKNVICVMNGNFESGGLADRLRTIVSVYQLCKEQDVPFRVLFTSPFNLIDYLIPNKYEWQISHADVHFTTSTQVICCEITDDTPYQSRNLHHWLTNKISSSKANEIHIYGNPNFSFFEGTYSQLFHELFSIAPSLQAHINKHLQALSNNFIVIQLRFTALLGDLTDYGTTLSPADQQQLITNVINKVQETAALYAKGSNILVCSDSAKFLAALTTAMPEVYIVPGDIKHIDYTDSNTTDAYTKLFTEFFLMTHAHHIYRITTTGMRKSGLPLSASILSGIPITDITF